MNYDRLAATALRLLTNYGQSAILRSMSLGTYDPNTSVVTQDGSTGSYDQTRKIVATDQPGKRFGTQFGQSLTANTLDQTTEKWIYMDANGRKPNPQDLLIFGGITYNIIDVQETNPGGTPLLYLIVLRV